MLDASASPLERDDATTVEKRVRFARRRGNVLAITDPYVRGASEIRTMDLCADHQRFATHSAIAFIPFAYAYALSGVVNSQPFWLMLTLPSR